MLFERRAEESAPLTNSGTFLYEFELNHNVTEVTKNICCAKDESAVDQNTVTKWFKKFWLGLQELRRSGCNKR